MQPRFEEETCSELQTLTAGLGRLSQETFELRLRTGLDALPSAAEIEISPADQMREFLSQLLNDNELQGLAQLSRDLTAAAHLSVADYLGGLDWRGHKQTMDWYAVMKSRPSFRAFLGERMEVIAPPAHYDKVDFF